MASCRSTQRHLTDSTPNTTSRPDRLTVASALSRTSSMQTASWRHRCGVRHLHIDICLVVALMSSFVPRFSFTRILLQNLPPPNRNALCLGIDVGLRASPPELERRSLSSVATPLTGYARVPSLMVCAPYRGDTANFVPTAWVI